MAVNQTKRKRTYTESESKTAEGAAIENDGELAVPKKMAKATTTPKKEKRKKKWQQANEEATETVNYNHNATFNDENAADDESRLASASPGKQQKKHAKQKSGSAQVEAGTDMPPPPVAGTNEEDETSPDSGIEPEAEAKLKFSKDFKMLHFRTKLRGSNFIAELRHFLYLSETRPKLIAKYVEKRGKPLELAEALERIDKSNTLHVSYLCEALQLVVMELLTNQKQHMESAVYACRYFLKVHSSVVEQLLRSAVLKHRRIALKLLTAIVCVEPQLGRQVLSSYDILSNAKQVDALLSHSKLDAQTGDSVRKCFIHFVLAFLIEGNTLLIRNIIDRGHLLRVLIKGLYFDEHVTACLVLNTLRKYVLECADISKTKKLHVFDLECCKHLNRLYSWVGPKGLPAFFSGKRLPRDELAALGAPEARDAVAAAVHELLLLLLTSRKHGITFDAVTHFRQKHNSLQGKVIGALYMPYLNERCEELVVKVLQACPDLARHTVRNFASLVNVARTPRADIPRAANFLTRVISAVTPKLLAGALDKMTLTDCTFWLKEACLPVEALTIIKSTHYLTVVEYEIRFAINKLLTAMLTQYVSFVAAITQREQAKREQNSLRRFKFEMLNHLLVHFPTIDQILHSLGLSIQRQRDPNVDVLAHLSLALDLVLLMCKENRAFIHKTSQILDYLDVLRPLYESNFAGELEGDARWVRSKVSHIKLELKTIKTILLLFPRALQPEEPLFEKVLNSFMKAYLLAEETAVQQEAGALLHSLFLNTGIFDSCSYEIDLWLAALRYFEASTMENIAAILLQIFRTRDAAVEMPPLSSSESTTNAANLQRLFKHIDQGLSVQGYIENLAVSKFLPLILDGVEIAEPYDKYIELVCLLLLHYYPAPAYVQQIYCTELTQLNPYMLSWLPSADAGDGVEGNVAKCQVLDDSISTRVPLLQQLQVALLAGKQPFEVTFSKSKSAKVYLELELSGAMQQLHATLTDERMVMIYAQQILFLVSQLLELHALTAQQAELAATYLTNLLQVMRKHDDTWEVATDASAETESKLESMLHYIYGIRLNYMRATELLSAAEPTQLHYLRFLRLLTDYCKDLPSFEKYAANYRLKLIKAVAISLEDVGQTKADSAQLEECVKLVHAFQLTADNCVEMLNLLTSKLKSGDYFAAGQPTIYYELLLCMLRRLVVLQQPVDCTAAMQQVAKYYRKWSGQLAAGAELPLESLEATLCDFLQVYHQHIVIFDAQCFACFYQARKLSKSSIKLACLLLERNSAQLGATFLELLPAHIEQKELSYALLDVAFKRALSVAPQVLQSCYQAYKNGFMRSIEKPQKAAVIYKEHADCSVALVQQCMPKSECIDFCKKQLKVDALESYQLKLMQAIYAEAMQAAKSPEQRSMIFVNFVGLLVQLLGVELKKATWCLQKLELLAWFCADWWRLAPAEVRDAADFTKLLTAQQWLNYCKTSLKLGMHSDELGTDLALADARNGLLLKLLAFLCDKLYADYNEETGAAQQAGTAAQLFELICSHSKCLDILSHNRRPTAVKTRVLQLLQTLARKAPQAMQREQIPIVLGAYQARLTAADRYALALLELYERYDVGLQHYRPFIWGDCAVAFYALRADEEERLRLQQQETSIMQVMSLIDKQVCLYTIDNFPIWRSLHGGAQLPDAGFEQPARKVLNYAANALEQRIEEGETSFDKDEMRLCPKRDALYEQCYDPAFFVPLMSHCFAPGSFIHAARPVQNGLLALVFTALASLDRDMRLAAACCQQRYRQHFEQAKFFEKPLWSQAYENIQAGLCELRTSWLQHKHHGGTPRVPLIPTLFIAKTFTLTTEPTHLLYKQLTMFLRLKSTFNFQVIPEFNVLFYSHEVEHQEYRQFIVEVMRSGIKCNADLFQLVTTNTFKVLMSYYGGTGCALDINLLILSLFSTCVKIPGSVKIMLDTVGVLPWLSGIVADTEFYHFDIVEGIISIINNLWYSVKASAPQLHNYAQLQLAIYRLILQLLPVLSARIGVGSLAKLLNIMQKTAHATGQHLALGATQLDLLLDCAAKHFPAQVSTIRCLRKFGGACAKSHEAYCTDLCAANESAAELDRLSTNGVLALSSLRAFVIDWWQAQAQAQAEVPSVV